MRHIVTAFLMLVFAAGWAAAQGAPEKVDPAVAAEKGCLSCHEGIEDFTQGVMMETIQAMGPDYGDPEGCVVCHGGNPQGLTAEEAHAGTHPELAEAGGPHTFYPDPGAVWIADKSCGQCHEGYADRLIKSLMNTEAGKLQGNLWSWGVVDTHRSVYGNYSLVDEDGFVPSVGTDAYKEYMVAYAESHPDQLPSSMEQVPEVDVEAVSDHPQMAGITYSRQQCQRCHVGVNGREKRGDYRGAGCSSCHVPYSNEGLYEGGDPTIDKEQPGKLLTHQMQGSRKSVVKHGDVEYSGIPAESCVSCHNRGKRIGTSYQGVMEFPYGTPYNEGSKQPKLHTKSYLYIKEDLHHAIESRPENPEGRMLCQDCHTTVDMHGDGNLPGTTLAQVEIECEDCHGTVSKFPWELPLGYGEEHQLDIGQDERGLTDELTEEQYFAQVYDAEDGYLLSARGNPLGNVVKKGSKVIMHSASGLDFEVPVLKQISQDGTWKSPNAKVAMNSVGKHMESMECYACHADWAPQCYGCHVTVDYSEGKTDVDWINNANARLDNGLTGDAPLGTNGLTSPGKVSESRSFLRWEEPTLGINGEGRVSPLMPGCQVITTVIDKDGNVVAKNEIWMTPDADGTKGLDHAAVQPHTAGREARTCESCHNNPKALGYGISGGRFMAKNSTGYVIDLETPDGDIIPQQSQFQAQPIPQLDHDLSRIVTEDGKQLVTVGSHWPLTGPLPQEMREKMERTGLCMGCHQNMTDAEVWDAVNSPNFVNNEEHQGVMDQAIHALANEKSK